MRFEPPIDRARLLEVIRQAYAIDAAELRFLPIGFGACYELRAVDGSRYFLKLWPYLHLGEPAAAQQLASLALAHTLHARVPELRVPDPLATRDAKLSADLDGAPLALFAFIDGVAHPPRSPALDSAVAGALAALHRATPLFEDQPLRREAFELAFEPALRRHLDGSTIDARSRPGLLAVRAWLLASRAEFKAQLAKLHALRVEASALPCAPVLCHTDLHGNNVLVDGADHVHILDWDDARLAPPEHDLWTALGEHAVGGDPSSVRAFLEAYRAAGVEAPLHLAHFAFYLLRRYLEDVSVVLGQLLEADADARDDETKLGYLHAEGVPRWSRLDETLGVLGRALRGAW